jgi:hypothetical protein
MVANQRSTTIQRARRKHGAEFKVKVAFPNKMGAPLTVVI